MSAPRSPNHGLQTTVSKAIESLGFHGAAAFPVLLHAYDAASPVGREQLWALALATRPAVVAPEDVALAVPWFRDPVPIVRGFAAMVIEGAGRSAGADATTALGTAIEAESDEGIAGQMRLALAKVDPLGRLGSDDRERRLAALAALDGRASATPADLVPAIVVLLADPEDDLRGGAVVLVSSVLLGRDPAARAPAAAAAVEAWKHAPSGAARTFLPLCLARAAKDHPPALEAWHEALASSDDGVRTQALLSARELVPVPDAAVTLALRVLRTSSPPELRQAAAHVLGVAGAGATEAVVPALAVGMVDADAETRRACGTALGSRGAPDAAAAAIVRAALAATPDVPTQDGGLTALEVVGTGTPDDVAVARALRAHGRHPATRIAATEFVLRWAWDAGDDARAALGLAAMGDDAFARAAAWGIVGALVTAKRPVGPWVRSLLPAGAPPRVERRHALLRCRAGDVDPVLAARIVEFLTTLPDLTSADEAEEAPVLVPLLGAPRPAVRASAALAFRSLGFSAELAAAALAAIEATDPDPRVRAVVARTIAVLRRRGMTVPDSLPSRR